MRTLVLLAVLLPVVAAAQFPIGSRNITFTDPSRGGRQIPCEVYYPAVTAGNNTAVAAGSFPLLAFGHGFAMGVNAYYNLRDAFVPEGYILVLPTTEGGLLPAPSHGDFGLDLAFVIAEMHVDPKALTSTVTGTLKTFVGAQVIASQRRSFRFRWSKRGLSLALAGFEQLPTDKEEPGQ